MKKIKICAENNEKMEKAIKEAEGRSRGRLLDTEDIYVVTQRVESWLHVPLRKLSGLKIHADVNGQTFCNSYRSKGSPMSTHFEAEVSNGKWYLTDVKRDWCGGPRNAIRLYMTPELREEVLNRMTSMEFSNSDMLRKTWNISVRSNQFKKMIEGMQEGEAVRVNVGKYWHGSNFSQGTDTNLLIIRNSDGFKVIVREKSWKPCEYNSATVSVKGDFIAISGMYGTTKCHTSEHYYIYASSYMHQADPDEIHTKADFGLI